MILDLLRPTVETPFAIDWDWFKKHGIDAQLAVRSQLCQQCRREFNQGAPIEEVDWVDPNSGEVFRVDSLREHIMAPSSYRNRCRDQSGRSSVPRFTKRSSAASA